MMHVRRTFSHALRLLTLTALLGASVAYANEYANIQKLLSVGKSAEALAQTDQLLRAKPRDPQLRFLRGIALTQEGKREQAIAVFTKLTQDYPELPEPYNNLAVLYAGQNQFDKARAALEMAIRTNPSYATAHENLGDVYARLASSAYNKALQMDATQTASVQPKLELIQGLPQLGAVPAPIVVAAAPAIAAKPAPAPAPSPASAPPPPPPPPVASPVAAPAVAAAPVPAPAPAPTAAPVDAAAVAAVTTAVQTWASAWGNKDLNTYFAAYAKDAVPSGKQSRKQWEADRRARITGKTSISVKVQDLKVSPQGDSATARFRQDYSAGALQTSSRKTLELRKVQGRWVIVRETVGQ